MSAFPWTQATVDTSSYSVSTLCYLTCNFALLKFPNPSSDLQIKHSPVGHVAPVPLGSWRREPIITGAPKANMYKVKLKCK